MRAAVVLGIGLWTAIAGWTSAVQAAQDVPPNILFIIMDDVGIDQMQVFGYGGPRPPKTPTLEQIAGHGVRFKSTWSMPACSTSRAVIFTGRFPLRTNVFGALGPSDLANSMVSPFETTTPKLLATKGYTSALFGKFHLGLQGNNPAGYAMVHDLGWNFFAGPLDETGDPSSIDTTAGGVAPVGTYSCGFVPGATVGGADTGACYMPNGSCQVLTSQGLVPPGRTCRDQGGILDPGQSCQSPAPGYVNFQTLSGHYVSPLVYNFPDGSFEQVPPTDLRARRFRAAVNVNDAISWINDRPVGRPWMATVSFSSAHTPLMQPPVDLAQPGNAESSNLDCSNTTEQRGISNLMIESIDAQVARLLVGTGLAHLGRGDRLVYSPRRTDTMVIIVGDNGSLGSTVKPPFDGSRAKGTAYQTGVWVPLIVAGPLVNGPDRIVSHMVNIADLYALFGEIAGIQDVRAAAAPRTIDAVPMLPYLVNRNQGPIRDWNFTQVSNNLQANGGVNGPCTISSTCTQIPVTKSVCEDNAGTWWGAGHDAPATQGAPAEGYTYCCQVNAFLASQSQPTFNISPLTSVGIRNRRYKIVQNFQKAYVSQDQPCVDQTTTEFYEINEAVPVPKLDRDGTELPIDALTRKQQQNYDALSAKLADILASQPSCPGDGNGDLLVNGADLVNWNTYTQSTGLSSVYDVNLDGFTNAFDQAIIQQNQGLNCRPR